MYGDHLKYRIISHFGKVLYIKSLMLFFSAQMFLKTKQLLTFCSITRTLNKQSRFITIIAIFQKNVVW